MIKLLKEPMTQNSRKELLIKSLRGRAYVYELIGENKEAIKDLRIGIEIAKDMLNTKFEAGCLLQLSTTYSFSSYEKMLHLAKEAQRHFQKIGDKEGEGESFVNIGYAHYVLGDYKNALKYYEASLKKFKALNYREGEAASFNNMGVIFKILGNYKSALKYYKNSFKIRKEIGNRLGCAESFNNIGVIYSDIGDYKNALSYYNKSLKILEETGCRMGQAYVFTNLGRIFQILGDNKKALGHYKESLQIVEEIDDKRAQAVNLRDIGQIYIESRNYQNGKKYLKDAEVVAKKIGNKEVLRRIYVSFAELEMTQNNTEKAKEYTEKALNLAEEMDSKSGKAEALLLQARILNQGLLRVIKGDEGLSGDVRGTFGEDSGWQIADRRFKEAIKLFEELKQPFDLAKAYYYYGEFLLRRTGVREKIPRPFWERAGVRVQEEEKGATEYLQKAREIFERIGAKIWLKKVDELIQLD